MNNLNGEGFNNTLTDIFSYADKAAGIYSTVKTPSSGSTSITPTVSYNPNLTTTPTAVQTPQGMSTNTKLILAGVGAAGIIGLAIFMGSKKKRKK